MDKNSSTYTFIFAVIITTIAAVLLGSAATALKPMQERNADVDKKSKTLLALGLFDNKMTADEVQAFFTPEGNEGRVVKKFAVSNEGDVIEVVKEKKEDSFQLTEEELKNLDLFLQVKNIKEEAKRMYPIFAYFESNEAVAANKPSQYVVPIFGYGLWSNCFGVVSLDSEGKTINNLVYYKHAETPGLGGEIEKEKFSNSFKGKKVHDASGAVAITTSKSPVGDTQVPAISGATFTMDGVNLMLKTYLTIYGNYFAKTNQGGK